MGVNLLYYKYPYMSNFKARVLSCTENSGVFEIILENTIFYPEGGGQPSDIGNIGECFISHVYRTGDNIIHIGDRPLAENLEYDAAIDWARRFDHMQHHSAEHLLSGIAHKLYGADNVGFSIGPQHVTIDFNVQLSREEIINLEVLANEAVFKNLAVGISYFDKPPTFSYRSKKELSGTIRIVSIDNYDTCACAGTQLKRTGEIGLIKIVSSQNYKSGSRLYLLCGQRALRDYQAKEENLLAISTLLSSKPYETAEHVMRLYEEKESLAFELLSAKYKIIDLKIEKLMSIVNSFENSNKQRIFSVELGSGSQGKDKPCPDGEGGGASSTHPQAGLCITVLGEFDDKVKTDEVLVFDNDLSAEEMKRYVANLSENFTTVAIFSGCDSEGESHGFRYMITSSVLDLPVFIKDMNGKLNGKGGGKGTAFGRINTCKSEIENYFRGD